MRQGHTEVGREWPEQIRMSPEIRHLVDRRWDEYGLSGWTRPDVEGETSRLF